MSPITRDPLALVAIQGGRITTPRSEAAAAGANKLEAMQRAIEIGEPVPIVFARQVGGSGGVLISPGASECRFQNDSSNNVTAWYQLVLSEGQIDSIPVKDVFQQSCRRGTHSQNYSMRSGNWAPGNALIQRDGYTLPDATNYCGSVGTYSRLTTMSFRVTIPNGFDQWKRQVHVFIRGGMYVRRLLDNAFGPSNNFADLVRWMLLNIGRIPADLVDNDALLNAARFASFSGFRCDCVISKSANYTDLVAQWAPYFLLSESNANGKRGLRPLLPTTSTGAMNTGTITPVFNFTEDNIIPDSVEIQYTDLAQRKPFAVSMIWRQQPENDFGIIRTTEVRYADTSSSAPYESHDLSEFCTSETHAARVGAYILAQRRYTTHTIRFSARPEANTTLVRGGDIIRVRLARQASTAAGGYHDFLYQVQRITKTLSGLLSYEATHFPIDSQGRSQIALDVAATQGTGIVLPSNRTGASCDINSAGDNSVPATESSSTGAAYPAIVLTGGGSIGLPTGDLDNPGDGLDGNGNVPVVTPTFRDPGGSQVPPRANAIVEDYNPCGNGAEPSKAYYVNGQLIGTSNNLPAKGRVVGSIVGSYSGGQTFEIYYYCADANGQQVLTAKSSPVTLLPSSNGTPVSEQVYAGLMNNDNPNAVHPYPDGYVNWIGPTGWISSPATADSIATSIWAWGGVNNRKVADWVTVKLRYANGAIEDFSSQVPRPESGYN